jgi:predicted sugar kinase
MKNNLPNSSTFIAGTVFNELKNLPKKVAPKYRSVTINFPSRLEAISLDPSKIAEYFVDNIYPAGQIDFCVNICKTIKVKLRKDGEIKITNNSPRKSLILHSAKLMKLALNTECGFNIDIKTELELKHCGLGSSSSIIQGVAAAINELFGNPIKPLDLIHFMTSNHGEEIDGDDERLIQVQSVGGSGICGHFNGGIIVNAGKAVPIFRANLPRRLKVIIGVPKSFSYPDSNELMSKELENMDGFKNTGERFAGIIAYRLINEAIPGIIQKDYKPCKDLIFDYRWDMGSIKNCSFVCPEIIEIAEKLRPLKNDQDIIFMSLSSVGPGFFVVSENAEKARKIFKELGMKVYNTDFHNSKYKIIERTK